MKRAVIISILLLATTACMQAQEATERDDNRQYVGWGLYGGPTLTGYRMEMGDEGILPEETWPGTGLDIGAYTEYHITERWSVQLSAALALERVVVSRNDSTNHITTFGIDIALPVQYRVATDRGAWHFSAGPYTHFIFSSCTSGKGTFENPFTRVIGNDPRTGEPTLAMGDFNAGLAFSAGYELASHWQVGVELKWGLSDLLNVESHELYVRPYKVGVMLGYNFE